jgi:hypothetical protein
LIIFSVTYYLKNTASEKKELKVIEYEETTKNMNKEIEEAEVLVCKHISKRDFEYTNCRINSNWSDT